MLRRLITLVALAIAVPVVLRQARRPGRWIGRPFLWAMNRSHSALTDWGLSLVDVGRGFSILDVGCGGGRTVRKLAEAAPEGRVCGIDVSAESVAVSRATNARLVEAGRVEIRQAPVSHLPYPDAAFDLVTAVETHYYWPDLPNDLREVLRVVRPGGTALVVAETYKGGRTDLAQRPVMALLGAAHLDVDGHREWFASAGFTDVQVFEEERRGWICVTGRRPA